MWEWEWLQPSSPNLTTRYLPGYVRCLQPTRRVPPSGDQIFKQLSWWGTIHNHTIAHLIEAGIHSRFHDFIELYRTKGLTLQNNHIFTTGILRARQSLKTHEWSSLSRGFTLSPKTSIRQHDAGLSLLYCALYSVGWQKNDGRNLKFFPMNWAQNREAGFLKNLFMGLWNSQLWFHSFLIISISSLPLYYCSGHSYPWDTGNRYLNSVPKHHHGFKCMVYQIQYSVSKRYPGMGEAV